MFFITAVRGGRDLSGVKVEDLGARTIYQLAAELAQRAGRMKAGDDRELARSKRLMDRLPAPLLSFTAYSARLLGAIARYDAELPAATASRNVSAPVARSSVKCVMLEP